jgi:hypothetical protein
VGLDVIVIMCKTCIVLCETNRECNSIRKAILDLRWFPGLNRRTQCRVCNGDIFELRRVRCD